MDKNKSDKLKEILNQTISQEEIEKKLKKEIKKSSLRREELKQKEHEEAKKLYHEESEKEKTLTGEKPSSENNTKEEDKNTKSKKIDTIEEIKKTNQVIIPTVRDKKKDNKGINVLLFLASTIAILLFIFVIYLFMSKDILNNKTSNTVETKDTPQEIIVEKFYKKDTDIEIKKEITTVEPINDKPKDIVKTDIDEKKPKEQEIIIKEVIKEKIITKLVKLDKKNFKTFYNSTKFNTLKCYDFKAGNVFPTKTCKTNLNKFLKNNKNAIRFEIIPVIAEDDNIIFNKLQPNIKSLDKSFQNRVQEYMYRGLSRERVLETTWYIKDTLGEDSVLTPTNYYVKSKKNNKGIIIKAYH